MTLGAQKLGRGGEERLALTVAISKQNFYDELLTSVISICHGSKNVGGLGQTINARSEID